jgi:hypothetical protein
VHHERRFFGLNPLLYGNLCDTVAEMASLWQALEAGTGLYLLEFEGNSDLIDTSVTVQETAIRLIEGEVSSRLLDRKAVPEPSKGTGYVVKITTGLEENERSRSAHQIGRKRRCPTLLRPPRGGVRSSPERVYAASDALRMGQPRVR